MEKLEFKSSYFYRFLEGDRNPFRPNKITIDENFIEVSKRNWHLVSVDTNSIHFQNVIGINVDKHLFGATVIIQTSGSEEIMVVGFRKKRAMSIKEECSKYISLNTQRSTTDIMADKISSALSNAMNNSGSQNTVSAADEILKFKQLLDQGIISEAEFDARKRNLLK